MGQLGAPTSQVYAFGGKNILVTENFSFANSSLSNKNTESRGHSLLIEIKTFMECIFGQNLATEWFADRMVNKPRLRRTIYFIFFCAVDKRTQKLQSATDGTSSYGWEEEGRTLQGGFGHPLSE